MSVYAKGVLCLGLDLAILYSAVVADGWITFAVWALLTMRWFVESIR